MSIETENTPLGEETTTPEINTSAVETLNTETPEATKEVEVKTKKPKILLFVLLGLMFLGGAAYAAFFFTTSESSSEDNFATDSFEQEEQFTDIETDITPELTYSNFSGEYIDAVIPTQWQIIEHKDGDGSDMLIEGGSFSGLTGLSILNEMEEEVFKLHAVWGIGGIDVCSTVAKFPDTPQSYIDKVNGLTIEYNANTESEEAMPVVSEFAEGEYTNFKFLDYRARRVGSTFYWNDLTNDVLSEFHPLCGINGSFLVFETLSFEASTDSSDDLTTGGTYGFDVTQGLDEDTLSMLDSVFDSMLVK